jgi:hypothetical protein
MNYGVVTKICKDLKSSCIHQSGVFVKIKEVFIKIYKIKGK